MTRATWSASGPWIICYQRHFTEGVACVQNVDRLFSHIAYAPRVHRKRSARDQVEGVARIALTENRCT
jgi:hypothetical protein